MKRIQLLPIGETLLTQTGSTVLTSLLAKQMNVKMSCGGRGYCSTCRISVKQGMDQLTEAESREKKTLSVVANATPDCRLACQARVLGDGIVVEVPKGMYIEKAEDLIKLLGTRAPENILHPIDGRILIPKDKIITRSLLEQSRSLEKEVERIRDRANGIVNDTESSMSSIQRVGRFMATGSGLAPTRINESFATTSSFSKPSRVTFSASEVVGITPPRDSKTAFKLEVGSVIDKFQLLEEIGSGGAGVVYKALHTKLKSVVAMKFLKPHSASDTKSLIDRFRNEARLLAQLNHPNVVRVIDFEDTAAMPYVVMEYVEGVSASRLIKRLKSLPLGQTIEILQQVTEGLKAALKFGIVHRDVKPGNILVGHDGVTKLVDLGLAIKVRRSDGTENQHLAAVEGTVGYMAPEQIMDGVVADHRADIYSLGITFYHLITGRLPFAGTTREEVMYKHRNIDAIPAIAYVPELPEEVSAGIASMMEKDPAKRPQTYDDVLKLLSRMQTGQSLTTAGA